MRIKNSSDMADEMVGRAVERYQKYHEGTLPTDARELAPFLFLWPSDALRLAPGVEPPASSGTQFWDSILTDPTTVKLRCAYAGPPQWNAPPEMTFSFQKATGQAGSPAGFLIPGPEFFSPVYAGGTDDKSRFKRWECFNGSFGEPTLQLPYQRFLYAARDLELLVDRAVSLTGDIQFNLATIQAETSSAPVNLIPCDEASADITLSTDQVQAFRIDARVPGGDDYDYVLYYTLVNGMTPSAADSPITLTTRSAHTPYFGYERYVGRGMTLLGAWKLAPLEQATLP